MVRSARGMLIRPIASQLNVASQFFFDCCESNAPKHVIRFLHGWHEKPRKSRLVLPSSHDSVLDLSPLAVLLKNAMTLTEVQKRAYQTVCTVCFKRPFHVDACTRVNAWLGKYLSLAIDINTMQQAIALLQNASPYFASTLLKTWCNAWTSAYRLGNTAQKLQSVCRFCGQGSESIHHLLMCDVFFQEVFHAFKKGLLHRRASLPPWLLQSKINIVQIIGLRNPCHLADFALASCLHHVFHAIQHLESDSSWKPRIKTGLNISLRKCQGGPGTMLPVSLAKNPNNSSRNSNNRNNMLHPTLLA